MGATQQLTLGQGAAVSPALTKSVSDSFTLSDAYDTFINSPAQTKSVSDSFALTDAGAIFSPLAKTISDALALTDASSTSLETPPSSLLTNIIAFWKLGEASGTRSDSVASNHLTDNNTVTQVAGKVGNAAQFTAANNEWLSIDISGSTLGLSNQSFTLSCWVYPDTTHSANIMDQRNGYSLYTTSNVPRLYVEGTGSGEAAWGSALSNSTWYHIVAWHDQGVGVSISVNNGTPVFTSYTGGITNTALTFALGRYNPGTTAYWNGRIDAVGIWTRVLTSGERTTLYAAGSGIEWPFS